MKNREIRALIASMMLVSLVAGSLLPISVNVPAKGETTVIAAEYTGAENTETAKQESADKEETEKKAEEKSAESASEDSDAKPTKSETVYAKIDSTGSVKSVTVSDQLKNISGESKFKDISDLEDIINVKGDEAFSMTGKDLVWDAKGEDICYQGTTSKELPVGIEISYKLDGKDITAAALEGKSGHLVMRYTYKNKTSGKDKTATPFMIATGLVLDEENFKNVVVTNGKLMSDGERNVAIGYGFPAMNDILDVEDLDIPDYFEVEADVTDFQPVEGMTIATNSVFNDLETDGFDSLEDLGSSMEELQDASSQLVSGSGELKNGIDTLLASSGTLVDGIGQLASGGEALQSGTGALEAGGNALAEGNAALADGTGQLLSGTQTLASGASQLNAGLKLAADQTQNELLPGVKALDAGVTQMQESLGTQLPALCSGISELDAAVNTGTSEVPSLVEAGNKLSAGAKDVADGAEAVSDGLEGIAVLLQGMAGGGNSLSDGSAISVGNAVDLSSDAVQKSENMVSQAQALSRTLEGAQQSAYTAMQGTGGTQNALLLLQQALSSEAVLQDADAQALISEAITEIQNDNAAKSNAAQQAADQAASAMGAAQALSADANGIISDTAKLSDQAAAVDQAAANVDAVQKQQQMTAAEGLAAIQEAMGKLVPGAETVKNGAKELQGGMQQLNSGIQRVAGGISQLDAKVNDSQNGLMAQVDDGVTRLKAGTSQLVAGVEGESGLVSGLNQLAQGASAVEEGSTLLSQKMGEANEGAKSAASGALELASGASQLNAGAITLKDGLYALQSGSGALISGVQQLDDGAAELNSGMIQFDKDGIQKLVDVFDGDIEGMLDKMNETLDNSRAYKSFSGISDDMDGDVKFVFITEG